MVKNSVQSMAPKRTWYRSHASHGLEDFFGQSSRYPGIGEQGDANHLLSVPLKQILIPLLVGRRIWDQRSSGIEGKLESLAQSDPISHLLDLSDEEQSKMTFDVPRLPYRSVLRLRWLGILSSPTDRRLLAAWTGREACEDNRDTVRDSLLSWWALL